jgi:hypothetical protein
MTGSQSPILFRETLRGVPSWLGVVLIASGVAGAVFVLLFSRRHYSDPVFWLAALPGLAALVLSPLAIAMWRLETEVRPGSLAVRLRPFTRREILLSNVESCEARTYRPMRDYLGWGCRVGPAGRALTVPGRHGVQLTLRGGERLLISSAQPEKLADAIRSAHRRRVVLA